MYRTSQWSKGGELKEEWKNITNYKGLYRASNYGNVRSLDRKVNGRTGTPKCVRGVVLSPVRNGKYSNVTLCKDGKGKTTLVHRIIASTFIKNPENKPFVNHLDSNSRNNAVDNLEWVTHQENVDHMVRKGRAWSKLKEKEVRGILNIKGRSFVSIAKQYNVSDTTIQSITLGKIWNRIYIEELQTEQGGE